MATSAQGQGTATTAPAKAFDGDVNAPSNGFLKNTDATTTLYWGYASAGLTSTTGFPLGPGASDNIPLDAGENVYVVTAASTATFAYARSRNLQRNT
jgi:hypothetical protein